MSNSTARPCGQNHLANSYDTHCPRRPQGPPGKFWNFKGDWVGEDFSIFAAGMWEWSHLPPPSQKEKCRDVGRDVVRCDRPLKWGRGLFNSWKNTKKNKKKEKYIGSETQPTDLPEEDNQAKVWESSFHEFDLYLSIYQENRYN